MILEFISQYKYLIGIFTVLTASLFILLTWRNSKIMSIIKNKWNSSFPHIFSMLKQLAIPFFLAASYGIWDWLSSNGEFSLSAYLKITMPALFFLMWFVGLYERQKKRSSDSESFNTLDQKIESLSDAVNRLNPAHFHDLPSKTSSSSKSFSQNMMTEAESVFDAGHHLAALLQAGVAFEQSVRSFAKHCKLENADHMPLLNILKKIDFLLPQGTEGELHALRQVRNQLAHASEYELRHVKQADNILRAYRWAIDTLENSTETHKKSMEPIKNP